MIEIRRIALFSPEHVVEEHGERIGTLRKPLFREDADLILHRGTSIETYRLRRTAFLPRRFELRGATAVEAIQRKLGKGLIELTLGSETLRMRFASLFSSSMVIESVAPSDRWQQVGRIRSRGALRSGARLHATQAVPLEIRIFLGWMAMVLWSDARLVA